MKRSEIENKINACRPKYEKLQIEFDENKEDNGEKEV